MKMSPPRVTLSPREAESGISVIDRDLPFERFIELHFGPREAEALRLGRGLGAASGPLHHIVVADRVMGMKAADAVQIFGSGTPSLFLSARGATEATVVVGQEATQDLVSGVQIGGTGQAEFAGEAILKGAPEAFDAALGLGTVGSNVGDAQLFQSAAKLRGFA